MKFTVSTAFILALCAVSFFASAQTGSDEATVTQIERDWVIALEKADTAAIDRLEAADYVVTDQDGQVHTKAQGIADLQSGAQKFETFRLDDLKVRVFGDSAIAFGLDTEKSSYKGKDTSGQYRFTDVFVKRDGRWQAVTTHVSKVSPP